MELLSARRSLESEKSKSEKTLMSLPIEMVEHILSYLSYDQLSKLRLVNKVFNSACSSALNKGFVQVQMFHNRCLKAVKSKLPRRESERKNHPLARHVDILMAVETRLSMLSMTFSKYIEARQCCFIPGKVLDEAMKVLRLVSISCTLQTQAAPSIIAVLPRPHDFLQEYRDISSMAMEHFDEKILPPIREKMKREASHLQRMRIKALQPKAVVRQSTANMENLTLEDKAECSRLQENYINIALAVGQCAASVVPPNSVVLKTINKTLKAESSYTHKRVVRINNKVKYLSGRMRQQNDILLKKLNRQRNMIRILKKELRETRTEINAMHKELHSLKTDLPFSKDLSHSEEPMITNLTIHAPSSTSALEADQSLSSKSYKRRRIEPDEDSDAD